ncbi:hypothetical protein K1X76_11455 [bacterium]|nr:hypothetical protein [bacterium]
MNRIPSYLSKPPLAEVREYPPLGRNDTVLFNVHTLEARSIRADKAFIRDDEILDYEAWPALHDRNINGVFYGITSDGRHVIHQASKRGCVMTCALMLALDHRISVDQNTLLNATLTNEQTAIQYFQDLGVTTYFNEIVEIKKLEVLITENGAAMVGIGGEIGGHEIIVDYLSLRQNRAIIRDPYHGWSITISADSLNRRMLSEGAIPVLQISK